MLDANPVIDSSGFGAEEVQQSPKLDISSIG
jgi:hypothetical protein